MRLSWRSHLVVDRFAGLALGRLGKGGVLVELVLPRPWGWRDYPGRAVWIVLKRKGGQP